MAYGFKLYLAEVVVQHDYAVIVVIFDPVEVGYGGDLDTVSSKVKEHVVVEKAVAGHYA